MSGSSDLTGTKPLKKSVLSLVLATSTLVTGVVAGTLSTITSAAHASGPICSDIFSEPADRTRIIALGVRSSATGEKHVQISYESEYTLTEAAPLLRDYIPESSIMRTQDWLSMSDQGRLDWIQARFVNKPEHATSSGLVRNVNIDFLPKELIVDSTGNLEIVINPPLDNYRSWENVVDTVVGRYGPGSQQAMVSKPREAAFGMTARNRDLEKQHLGWLTYTNLFDMFQKLKSGAERYRKDPTKLTALSFDHPFLGPMTKMKREKLEAYLEGNSIGQNYDEISKKYVRKSDASFKYTSGPSYRPDIAGPTRWSWEIRNAHKDVLDLKNKVLRDVNAHVLGLTPYRAFADVQAFDSVADFQKLPETTQNMLKKIFPSKADPRFIYESDEYTALQTYRNFALPLGDFRNLTKALASKAQQPSLLAQVNRASNRYLTELIDIEIRLSRGEITEMQAKARVMGALGEWSLNSNLVTAFELYARKLGHDPEYRSASKAVGE